jgi:hypothetical protein
MNDGLLSLLSPKSPSPFALSIIGPTNCLFSLELLFLFYFESFLSSFEFFLPPSLKSFSWGIIFFVFDLLNEYG